MKKFGKFLATTLSLAALAGGTFYLVKHFLDQNTEDDDMDEYEEDDFDEEFDDFDEEIDDLSENASASREYVPINTEPAEDSAEKADEEKADEESEDTDSPAAENNQE